MNYRLFWKLCLIIATGTVTLFYGIDWAVGKTEEAMSSLSNEDKQQLHQWAEQAEFLYEQGDEKQLNLWLQQLSQQEDTWVSVAQAAITHVAGSPLEDTYAEGYHLGRNIDWEIHLFFADNPIMEIPFKQSHASLLIQLPANMRPGHYWGTTRVLIQVILPLIVLSLVSYILYGHIMSPLRVLQKATQQFTQGHFDVRVHHRLGKRDDEIAELAQTFDDMAIRTGELIISQRQLIADLSHELRTPLARLDIAIDALESSDDERLGDVNSRRERLQRESAQIRKLVEDALTFAWLDNERPSLRGDDAEDVDLIDLLDVLLDDARFEFPDRDVIAELPKSLSLSHTSHRALGQAIENILRNAMRYTPSGKAVELQIEQDASACLLRIMDQGPGVPEALLQTIFKPFFRVEKSRQVSGAESHSLPQQQNFGLGLALAQRQLQAVGAQVSAKNRHPHGLIMSIVLPKY